MENILGMDITQISFASLFVWLLFYTIKNSEKREQQIIETNEKREQQIIETNEKREAKYQEMLDKLADKFNLVEETNDMLTTLKIEFEGIKQYMGGVKHE